ncbi:glycosyltransferase family 4 protein [Streptomyces cacaoi]|uniref:glycosyltransferase family 4 protein n=1 Tax=Streptomyces cacaoi TaxID=1898 RepID=UPI002611DB5C|nr:glycosyltransferase family 4 protein [Streptomyces cacaoi]
MKIVFLLDNAYGIGGTIRSTVNLSRALADRHQVEVVSLRRAREEPALTFDPRVTLTSLIDLRRSSPGYDGDDPLHQRPSERFTEGADHLRRGISTRLVDVRVRELLSTLRADVVIGTRPKVNDYLAAYGTGSYLRIGQEHLTHAMHNPHIRTHQDAAIRHLDAFVTVSYADAADYRAALPDTTTHITCVPNAVPQTPVEPSDGRARLVVAAGRLIKVKRYDRLLRAFALVAREHPEWSLRLYGRGPQHAALRALINELGLYDRAFLMGAHSPIETEWAKGAVAAVSSDAESFGMTLVEAMHCGVPVVSTDCRYGPGEIIANGQDGLLSPLGDDEQTNIRAYADALLQLIEDPRLRHRMGQAALEKAERYAPRRIAGEYEELIEQLLRARAAAGTLGAPNAPAPTADAPLMPPGAAGASGAAAPAGAANAAGAARAAGTGKASAAARAAAGNATAGNAAAGNAAAEAAATAETAASGKAAGQTSGAPGTRSSARGSGTAEGRAGGAAVPRPRMSLRRLAAPVLRPVVRRVRAWRKARGGAFARPTAWVRVADDGSLVVRLRAERLPRQRSALVLTARHRESEPAVRFPLPARDRAADGWTEVRVPRSGTHLAEARWDAYVERASDGKRRRVRAELVETARLLTLPAPIGPGGALTPWTPYTTSDGYLAVRAWRRAGHAEVTSIALDARGYTLRAALYGEAAHTSLLAGRTEPAGGPALVAVPRGKNAERRAFELPGRFGGSPSPARERALGELPGEFGPDNGVIGPGPTADGTGRPPAAADETGAPPAAGDEVVVELPYELPAAFAEGAGKGVWDLWLRPGEGLAPVRMGRLLGDLPDRKKTDVTPRARLGGSDLAVQLYFSVNNNLVLTLHTVPQEQPGAAGARPEQEQSRTAAAGTGSGRAGS